MELSQLTDREAILPEALKLGLLESEFALIQEKLGRTPTFTELAMFSGMWSEHCSYKNSILFLKELYKESPRLAAAPGEENAGALKINDKQAVVFKVESHNHPSALEPYQGAATGVGGIMRDIFTMGARPLVSLNSLRFGLPQSSARNRYLLAQVVKGIGDYGNSLGIACAGGELVFHESYNKNPLVNAMTVGIVDLDKMASSKAKGTGNRVLYVGAKTGRDGIHGASFASKELSNESAEERSAVQVGDPFMEKLLMEATLECIDKNLVVAVQDMGAAGLISSSSEMSSSGDVGMDIHIDRIPAREKNMQPFEFLLSESQERMLMVVEPKRVQDVRQVFTRWDLEAVDIGEITTSKNLRIFFEGSLYADVPAHYLTVNLQGAPRYRRQSQPPADMNHHKQNLDEQKNYPHPFAQALHQNSSAETKKLLLQLICHPNLASKEPLFRQYDTDIGVARLIGPGQNAGVYKVPTSKQALAVSLDGNSFYVALEPYQGAQHSVAECYRNICSSAAEPIGVTNCLNFANPYKPENFYFFERAVQGMSDACRFFETPVTGGNVSFYNESQEGPVLPTPAVGMVGLATVDAVRGIALQPHKNLYLIGFFAPQLACSQYNYILNNNFTLPLPALNLQQEKATGLAVRKAASEKMLLAAIDISSGGLLTALLRMLFISGECGFVWNAELLAKVLREENSQDSFFWGETASTYVVQPSSEKEEEFLQFLKTSEIPFQLLGATDANKRLVFGDVSLDLLSLQNEWQNALSYF